MFRWLRAQELAFDDVWDRCSGRKHKSKAVKQVLDFLKLVGQNHKFSNQRIAVWTSNGSGLGSKKSMFAKLKAKTGRGWTERWFASKAALRAVWRKRFADRARR